MGRLDSSLATNLVDHLFELLAREGRSEDVEIVVVEASLGVLEPRSDPFGDLT